MAAVLSSACLFTSAKVWAASSPGSAVAALHADTLLLHTYSLFLLVAVNIGGRRKFSAALRLCWKREETGGCVVTLSSDPVHFGSSPPWVSMKPPRGELHALFSLSSPLEVVLSPLPPPPLTGLPTSFPERHLRAWTYLGAPFSFPFYYFPLLGLVSLLFNFRCLCLRGGRSNRSDQIFFFSKFLR